MDKGDLSKISASTGLILCVAGHKLHKLCKRGMQIVSTHCLRVFGSDT
jgi:hypothetical protein